MNELWCTYTVENSVMEKVNKRGLHARTWLNLRSIILTVHCILTLLNLHVSYITTENNALSTL